MTVQHAIASAVEKAVRLALLPVLLGALDTVAQAQDQAVSAATATRAFADHLGGSTLEMFFSVAMIDRDSGGEPREPRRARIARQKQLREWLREHGGQVAAEDCEDEEDRRNLREYPETMAGRRLLALPRRQRLRLLREIEDYFEQFSEYFAASLTAVFQVAEPKHLPPIVRSQMQIRLRVRPRALPRERGHLIAAIYLPQHRLILFNPDQAAEDPAGFLDTFEHELWHHLLPGLDDLANDANLWWEGFNEAVSEIWSAEFHARASGIGHLHSSSVEYPSQAAFASLLLGLCRTSTLRFLTGEIGEDEFLAGLTGRGARGAALAQAYGQRDFLPPARRERVESVLTEWGWREDDGSRISLEYLLVDHRLDRNILQYEFHRNREFLMHFIQALTIVLLQDLRDRFPLREWRRELDLPEALQSNLRRVFNYTRNPHYPLANR